MKPLKGRIQHWKGRLAFNSTARLELYEQLASFLEGGVPLYGVIEKLTQNYQRTKPGAGIIIVLRDIMRVMDGGGNFSEALARWAPVSEVMLIQAGERRGNPSEAFRTAATTTEASKSMVSSLYGGLSYPVALMLLMLAAIYLFSVNVIPTLTAVKDPRSWPSFAQPLYTMSHFVEHYWWVVLLTFLVLIVAVVRSLPTMKGPARRFLDRVPPYSFYKAFQSSVVLISISSLMKAGVPLVDSIESLAQKSKGYVAHHLRTILVRLRAGRTTGDAFDTGFLTESSINNIRIYSELATLHDAMDNIGRSAVDAGIKRIKTLSSALNAGIIVFLGVYIGWVYMSFAMLMQSLGAETGGF